MQIRFATRLLRLLLCAALLSGPVVAAGRFSIRDPVHSVAQRHPQILFTQQAIPASLAEFLQSLISGISIRQRQQETVLVRSPQQESFWMEVLKHSVSRPM